MSDPTEAIRRQRVAEINAVPGSREALEQQHGQVWNTDELTRDFEVIGFLAPFVAVRRRSDGVKGTDQCWSSGLYATGICGNTWALA
jgi:hypothetical protein